MPLYWVEYGDADAPPLLLLHGGPAASHDYLLPQMLALAEDHRLVTYDQRGGGRSRHDDDRAEIGWRDQVADVARVAAELRVAPLVILGYSWGGLLAMLYATEAADGRVAPPPAKLALVDPAPITRATRIEFERELARRQASPAIAEARAELQASGLRAQDADAYRQRAFELSVAGYFADPARASDLTPFRVTGRVQQSIWDSLGEYDLTDALSRVHVPALVVHGRQDPIPLASSEAAARALGTTCVVIDNAGHVPYVEQPDQLFALLRGFLRDSASTHPAAS
ncbi:MAG TPA: alpha/beta fold hydrolase [Gemmatimonadaceae bacterium]|nr:alpha/beta fold hydrolase [Gemmatimonadaceae bacterium]